MDLKKQLSNVYFIMGTNCGGKTSVAKALSKKHGMYFYSADEQYWAHRKKTSSENQPNMNRPFYDWQEYFSRNPKEQAAWLLRSKEEQIPFIIEDLIELSKNHKHVIVDTYASETLYKEISVPERVVFLGAPIETIYDEFFDREDKQDLLNVIKREIDPVEKGIEQVKRVAIHIAIKEFEMAYFSQTTKHVRLPDTLFEERIMWVENHFKL